jgi:cystathionine gamma-synthase/methionine-gamma-lyase
VRSLEAKLAAVEGGQGALAFGSGMAAISATLLAHAVGGRVLCVGDVYGGTYELLAKNLSRLGVAPTFLSETEPAAVARALDHDVRVVFFESPTNPTLSVLDVAGLARVARDAGALSVVDNTFATPVNQQPLALGADIVVHSATKFLGGHSDLTGGAVIGAKSALEPVDGWRRSLGQAITPEVASLLARSLRTLVVRVRAQNASALELARHLERHPRVRKVHYPGLESAPDHELARRQMSGFGGVLSFVVDGDARSVVDKLRVFSIAASLGGVESLATQPVTTSHRGVPRDERERRGIVDGMVRASVGLEDVGDLWADLEQALV